MKKIHTIIIIIAAIALIMTGFLGGKLISRNSEPHISATSIEERLSKCSSLTTARLDYRGIVHYSDGNIQYIDKKSFSMIYDAQIKAGIDLSQAKVELQKDKITIILPKPTIQDIIIDSNSLEFYDEKAALFNWKDRSDTAKAIQYAKEDALEKANQTDILEQASNQAKLVIETLILPITEDKENEYQIEFIEKIDE